VAKRLLVLAAESAYQTPEILDAAQRLDVDVIVGNDRCRALAKVWRDALVAGPWPLDFRHPAAAAATLARRMAGQPVDGIVATDETTAVIAAMAAERIGLRHNPVEAARTAGNKLAFRRALTAAGLRQPLFAAVATGLSRVAVASACADVPFPLVIKPQHLSASRGVMRADDRRSLWTMYQRLCALLAAPSVRGPDPEAARTIVAEQYLAGDEVSFEGLLSAGELTKVAVFDKPDPLDGPFFTETIYVTPSSLDAGTQQAIHAAVAAAAAAIGLREGPVHAELRLTGDGPVVLELAARSIGGLCGRMLRYGVGVSVAELVLRHAVGMPVSIATPDGASGVMMLPVPAEGVVVDISGVDDARSVRGVQDVTITARVGDTVAPLPEGNTYMGFVFATAADADTVIRALRSATDRIRFRIAPRL